MAIAIQDILARLQAEGYENCFQDDGQEQIIVNNRGEIDGYNATPGSWRVHSRLDDENHLRPAVDDIDLLFKYIAYAWTKEEPK